jgi:hypothetical protein
VGFELSHGKTSEHVALSIGTSPPPAADAGAATEPRGCAETTVTVKARNTAQTRKRDHGTEYILTGDDKPEADPSLAEDIIELRLLTAGEPIGPANTRCALERHNF